MKTYKTYQEAKIANPESDIYTDRSGIFAVESVLRTHRMAVSPIEKCNPADYCMTVEKFLADGHKFVDGDIFMNHLGELKSVGRIIKGNNYTPDEASSPDKYDDNCFILRAAALEKTETPEEKEAFDVMAQDNEAAEAKAVKDYSPKPKRTKMEAVDKPEVGTSVMTRYTETDSEGWCEFHGPSEVIAYHGDYVWIAHHGKFNRLHKISDIEFKIETEITEREAFIDGGLKISNEINPYTLGKMFDSGKFKLV